MKLRRLISLSIALSFTIVFTTGVWSYFKDYSRPIATLHTVFGFIFSIGIFVHLKNNFRSLKVYAKKGISLIITSIALAIFLGAFYQLRPFSTLMDSGARLKASADQIVHASRYHLIEMNTSNATKLSIDVLRAEHYWHPQMAIWIEDEHGNYVETLFVSKATAKGLFFGGRNKTNFKDFDADKETSGSYRRVNALPVWSHKRNVSYADGLFVPPSDDPLPDAITGATITDNFIFNTSTKPLNRFKLKLEINVAFDDNAYYSEYDFPNDTVYHNGTGQLGQPSIVFSCTIDMHDEKQYYLMELIGHGHHSGQNGTIYKDLSKLTTAKHIIERIVVGVK
ncbi:hypothetical protein [Winogradskyella sp.]|uniref:hypothetical protein n=1 Tax=Winogradskyella sp. TaxID=1883156 RepID=UPI003BA8859E